MSFYVNKKDVEQIEGNGHHAFSLLNEKNGCIAGCCTGISVYYLEEYGIPGVHEDQEGFIVMEGTGWAKVGDEEFRIEPEVSFIAPAGVTHTIKKDTGSVPIKVFWFHAAI
ncbi:MAG: hypothetical protein K0S71_2432 [Clostridia bacterium]|nr:hypothetical protein [Clostridia bacterium]